MRKVGIKLIDDEHDLLFSMAEELNAAFCSSSNHASIVTMLTKIDSFIRKHFEDEEDLLARLDKTGLELKRHREAHAALLQRTEKLMGDSGKGDREVSTQLAELIEYWLNDHIQHYDMRLRDLTESTSVETA